MLILFIGKKRKHYLVKTSNKNGEEKHHLIKTMDKRGKPSSIAHHDQGLWDDDYELEVFTY